MDGHQHDPFHWSIPVADPSGRDRQWLVGARDGEVVMVVPPGEGFTVKNPRYAAACLVEAEQLAAMQIVGRTETQR